MNLPEPNTIAWHMYHATIAAAILFVLPCVFGWYSVVILIAIATVIATLA